MSAKLDEAWATRVAKAKDWNIQLASGSIKPSVVKRSKWLANAAVGRISYQEQEDSWRSTDGKKHASLTWALNDVLGRAFWAGGKPRPLSRVRGSLTKCSRCRSIQSCRRHSTTHGAFDLESYNQVCAGACGQESCWRRTTEPWKRCRYGHRNGTLNNHI